MIVCAKPHEQKPVFADRIAHENRIRPLEVAIAPEPVRRKTQETGLKKPVSMRLSEDVVDYFKRQKWL